ncbi:DUF5304 family protein [Streptomyces sp. CBMA156]|uniref:DUF5304 family protein n=1 Tax=Streptomyces sp. CBMA156 TaxID=1930280 RepID=UPI001661E80C|nr:DUF5304 family protein [Streptomyces sp. CBMA156]MBD0675845.1 hypothetical protein [Streptomyces sp. CBMA156]
MTSTDDRTEPGGDRTEPSGGRAESSGGSGDRAGQDGGQGSGQDGGQSHPFGPELGPLVDEVRRFAGALGEKAQEAGATTLITLSGLADKLRDQQPEVYSHLSAAGTGLAAAGTELLAAYRAAVAGHESRWTAGQGASTEKIDLDLDLDADADLDESGEPSAKQ